MTEKLLHFIWNFGYFDKSNLTTTEGESLTIFSPGILNTNGGPDFSSAKIKVGNTTLFGTLELHLKTSDWAKHGHQRDLQYRNVILHVVLKHDKTLPHAIPVLELEPRIATLLLERYEALMNTVQFIPCSPLVSSVKELVLTSWKERLLAERLTKKAENILTLVKQSKGHWEEIMWWLLARNFGMKVNADAFEAIARSISITTLAKHKASLQQLETLLFGQAGLLNGDFSEEYPKMLQHEYRFLQKKLGLTTIPIPLQFLRMRPQNFPTIRLAQLTAFVFQSSHLFSKIKEAETIQELLPLFEVTANDFWHYHYTFQQASPFKIKSLGTDSIVNLMINTVVPVAFAYGLYHKDETFKEKSVRWLDDLKAEKNNITIGFKTAGMKVKTASDSQAFIELKNSYCSQKRCLQCAVGNYLLKSEAGKNAVVI